MTDKGNVFLDFNKDQTAGGFSAKLLQCAKDQKDYVPALRQDHAALYRTLLYTVKPRKILEAGTLFGYSSILAAETLINVHGEDFRIDTVEIDPDNVSAAMKNIEAAGFSRNIRVIEGDACEVFSCLEGPYDLIFLDCSKSSYNQLFGDVKRLLRSGGLLLADDICYNGKLDNEDGTVPHKHRTIVNSLNEFISGMSSDKDFAAFIDTMDDGMLVAVRK